MKKAKKYNLWVAFVLSTFFVMFAIMLVVTVGIYLIIEADFPGQMHMSMRPLPIVLIVSAIIGTVLSVLVGRLILKPIVNLSEAAKKVASGDFSVRLETESRVTEIADLFDNFDRMVRELDGIETLRSDFVDNVSHEFRTPLAAIEGYATLLSDPTLSRTEQQDFSGLIIQSARQLSEMASNILKISKLENQQIVVQNELFSLDEQIRQVLVRLEPLWSEKALNLELDLDEAQFWGSEELMLQVWQNLLSNAVKFSPQGGTIWVKLISSPTNVVAIIKDQGIGMAEDELSHIFEKFYQADRTRSIEGNGLGLTLVKRVLDLFGGTIMVQSAPSKGSTFTVSLPKH